MLLPRFSSLLTVLVFASAASAVDLSKIERKIVKEPAYQSKPKYGLLVLGPEAKTRVWLVQDGDTLYVDRNGNGDLTEPEEKVAAEKSKDTEEGEYVFEAGDLRDGARLHKRLRLRVGSIAYLAKREEDVKQLLIKDSNAHGYMVDLEVEMPGHKGAAPEGRVQQVASTHDATGVLQFAKRPEDAPILHFGGPWQVNLFTKQRLTSGRETDLMLGVGSPGVGPGSFTWIAYENLIPADKYPTVDLVFAPQHPGDPPRREHYELKHRC